MFYFTRKPHVLPFQAKLPSSFHLSCHIVSSGIRDTDRSGFKSQLPSRLLVTQLSEDISCLCGSFLNRDTMTPQRDT